MDLRAVMVVRPQRAELLCQRLLAQDWVRDLVAVECRGYGRQREDALAGARDPSGGPGLDLLPKVLLSATIPAEARAALIETVSAVCRTGHIGDGKIFLLRIEAEMAIADA